MTQAHSWKRTVVRLDAAEQFEMKADTGKFMCETITYTGGSMATARGLAIKKDGSAALYHRETVLDIESLPTWLLAALVKAGHGREGRQNA